VTWDHECKKHGEPGSGTPGAEQDILKRVMEGRDEGILCRTCANRITSPEEMVKQSNRHVHTFRNPAGISYTIGCFKKAPGCLSLGESTDEFTWFPGFLWNYAVCSRCFSHLGWFYQTPGGDSFFGLILNQLINPLSYH
jgi:hypothetical protein